MSSSSSLLASANSSERYVPARRPTGGSIGPSDPFTPQELDQLHLTSDKVLSDSAKRGYPHDEHESFHKLDAVVRKVGNVVRRDSAERVGSWVATAAQSDDEDDADDEGDDTEDEGPRRRNSSPPRLRRGPHTIPGSLKSASRSSTCSSSEIDAAFVDTPTTTPATSVPPSPATHRSKLPLAHPSTSDSGPRGHSASDPTSSSTARLGRARKRASVHFVEPLPLHEADATDDAIRRLLMSHDRFGWCSVVERALEWPLGLTHGSIDRPAAESEGDDDDERREELDRKGLVNALWRQGKKSQSVEAHVDFLRRTFSAPSLSDYLFAPGSSTVLTPLTSSIPPPEPSPTASSPPSSSTTTRSGGGKHRRGHHGGSLVGLSEALESGGELTRCRSDPMICALGAPFPRMTTSSPPPMDEYESEHEDGDEGQATGAWREDGEGVEGPENRPKLKSALKSPSSVPKRLPPPRRVDNVEEEEGSGNEDDQADATLAGQAWSRIGGLMGGVLSYV